MYRKPVIQRFGSFEQLTQTGFAGGGDGCIVLNPATGAVVDGNPADGTGGPGTGLPLCEMPRNGS
jgi:hypothetical protein